MFYTFMPLGKTGVRWKSIIAVLLFALIIIGIGRVINIDHNIGQMFMIKRPTEPQPWSPWRRQERNNSIEDLKEDDGEEAVWMATREEEYALRSAHIKRVCDSELAKETRTLWKIQPMYFIKDSHFRMAFCKHPKVGSSTWLSYFIRLSQEIPEEKKKRLLSNVYILHQGTHHVQLNHQSPMVKDIEEHKQIFLFSFIRHPFERLVSAYWDKFYLQRDSGFARRAKQLAESTNTSRVTFESFLQLVLSQVNTSNMNRHWMPYYKACPYCSVDFDVIGKMESFDEDVEYIITKMNLTNRLEVGVKWNSSKDDKAIKNGSKSARANMLFSNVTSETVQKLCKVYQLDFLLFDFDYNEYCQV